MLQNRKWMALATTLGLLSATLLVFQNCSKLDSANQDSVTPASCQPGDNCGEPLVPEGAVSIKTFSGIICDGASSDQSALQTAITKIGEQRSSIIINCPLTVSAGISFGEYTTLYFLGQGRIKAVEGTSGVQLNGDVHAGRYKIFEGFAPGQVTFAKSSRVLDIFPEWFGALGGARGDDQIAFELAFKSMSGWTGQRVSLRGTYYSVSKCGFEINQSGIGVVGTSANFSAILCRSTVPNTNIIQINGSGRTAVINDTFVKNVALVSTEPVSGRTGLYLAFLVNFTGENIVSTNNTTQFFFTGVGSSQCTRCQGMYEFQNAGTIYGFRIDGSNWNASLRIINSNSGTAAALNGGTFFGAHISGEHINDLKFIDFETANVQYGVYVRGSGVEDRDILFINNIHDTFYQAGYHFENLGEDAGVSITGGWVAPANVNRNTYGISLVNSHAVTVSGVTFFPYINGAFHYHVRAENSSDLAFNSNTFKNAAYGIYALNSASIAVSGNTFSASQSSPTIVHVALVGSSFCALNGNTFSGYGSSAIRLISGSSNNRLNGNAINGINFGSPVVNEGTGNLISP